MVRCVLCIETLNKKWKQVFYCKYTVLCNNNKSGLFTLQSPEMSAEIHPAFFVVFLFVRVDENLLAAEMLSNNSTETLKNMIFQPRLSQLNPKRGEKKMHLKVVLALSITAFVTED